MVPTFAVSSATPADTAAASEGRVIAYWVTTVLLAAELGVGGAMNILRRPRYFAAVIEHLGYPAYFGTILGVWKLLGAVAVLAPHAPRRTEWAYTGAVFTFTGAVASHVAAGDDATTLVAPLVFTGLTIASWALRPSSRRISHDISVL